MKFSLQEIKSGERSLTPISLSLGAIIAWLTPILLRHVLAPVFIALLVAYIVDPLLCWLERHRVRRWIATPLLYIACLAMLRCPPTMSRQSKTNRAMLRRQPMKSRTGP